MMISAARINTNGTIERIVIEKSADSFLDAIGNCNEFEHISLDGCAVLMNASPKQCDENNVLATELFGFDCLLRGNVLVVGFDVEADDEEIGSIPLDIFSRLCTAAEYYNAMRKS